MHLRDKAKLAARSSHKFEPLEALDLVKIKNFDDIARGMSKTAFGGRSVGEAVDVMHDMVADPDCFVIGTFSGAMTVAKMGLMICDMIDKGMLDLIVTTGALMTHGFVESVGMRHLKYDFKTSDVDLYFEGYDRVFDTLEVEKNLDDVSEIVDAILDKSDPDEVLCSYKITRMLGEYLHKNVKGRGILKSAYEKNVPVFIPAFTDSELGLDLALYNRQRTLNGSKQLNFNPFLDLEHYTEIVQKQKKLGIFTIGGGVPRNWAQQVGPYLDLIRWRILEKGKKESYFAKEGDPYFKRFNYAVRICPEPVYWGGLSGCSYSEGVSWGKFVPENEGGRFAEVLSDATIAWPVILKAVMERMEKNKKN
ncbi:deoxyhypusine synthase family protein [Candidatus Woesearchaeota archaeon]|nr:deoxyhypusine synthase family protein [Candidatus Woesearchaeota archaeon]